MQFKQEKQHKNGVLVLVLSLSLSLIYTGPLKAAADEGKSSEVCNKWSPDFEMQMTQSPWSCKVGNL